MPKLHPVAVVRLHVHGRDRGGVPQLDLAMPAQRVGFELLAHVRLPASLSQPFQTGAPIVAPPEHTDRVLEG
jgi:hypothetical protein